MATPTPRPSSDPRRSSTLQKRTSILPRPSLLTIDDTVLIAQHASLTGSNPIALGPYVVLHPHAKISSALAAVVVGEGVVVHERARVGIGAGETGASGVHVAGGAEGVRLERYVVVETNAVVEAEVVGEGSEVGVGAIVGRGCVIGKFCTITPSSVIPPNTRIPDFTVVYGGSEQRIDRTAKERPEARDLKTQMHKRQLEVYKKLVPNNVAKWRMG